MLISISTNTVNFVDKEVSCLADLISIATTTNYSLGTFHNSYRNKASFKGTSAIGLDVDNDADSDQLMSLDQAIEAFKPYKHVILTTKSHGIEKHGIVADRFRVILFLDKPITEVETYYATWAHLKASYPAIDSKCKDPSRFWYPSPDVRSTSESGLLISPSVNAPVPKPQMPSQPANQPTGVQGALTAKTLNFLFKGCPAGSRNDSTYKAARDFYKKNYDLGQAIKDITEVLERLGMYAPDFTRDEVVKTIESAYKGGGPIKSSGNNKTLEANLLAGKLVIDAEEPSRTILYLPEKMIVYPIHKTAIRDILGKRAYEDYIKTNSVVANFLYARETKPPLYEDTDYESWIFNTYNPPAWRRSNYFRGDPLPAGQSAPPEVYDRFLNHLTGGHEDSVQYIYDWLSVALTARNYTILCAIGDIGIGKGILGLVMEKLVGESNFIRTRDEIFKNKFNGQLKNKVIVYVDEIRLKGSEEHNRLKDLANDKIEVENKGVDAKSMNNHASYYVSSNNMDAVQLDAGDRRFSIIELTDKKITETTVVKEIKELTSNENIEKLALHLLERPIRHDMMVPFYSSRTEEVKEATLAEWETFVIFDFCARNPDVELPVKELQARIMEQFGRFYSSPGIRKITDLSKKYPGYLRVYQHKDNPSQRWIKVLGAPVQYKPTNRFFPKVIN